MTVDRWFPIASRLTYDRPEPGTLVAAERAIWRIIETRDVPAVDREPDDSPHAYYVVFEPVRGGKRRHQKVRRLIGWHVVSEHYPVCVECHEPYPCLHLDAAHEGARAAERLDQLTSVLPGCCWACHEPITARQERMSFTGPNAWLPTAPDSPTFHLRQACRSGAARYEEDWVKADPTRPRSLLTLRCDGSVIVHGDGEAECFGAADSDCPSIYARHRAYAACYGLTHGCPRECSRVGHPGCYVRRPKGLLIPARERTLDA